MIVRTYVASTHSLVTCQSPIPPYLCCFISKFLFVTPNVPDSLTSQMSRFWMQKGLFHFGRLVDVSTRILRTFQDLQDAYDLPRQAFFSCLKIRYYAQSFTTNLQFSHLMEFKKISFEGAPSKFMISRIYQFLITLRCPCLGMSICQNGSRPWGRSCLCKCGNLFGHKHSRTLFVPC